MHPFFGTSLLEMIAFMVFDNVAVPPWMLWEFFAAFSVC